VVEVEIAASAIDYGGKRVICAAIRDITERKRTEEADTPLSTRTGEPRPQAHGATAGRQRGVGGLQLLPSPTTLRAPLRARPVFGRILLEDYGDELDEVGRDYPETIPGPGERRVS
jgi:hypothetical protein